MTKLGSPTRLIAIDNCEKWDSCKFLLSIVHRVKGRSLKYISENDEIV